MLVWQNILMLVKQNKLIIAVQNTLIWQQYKRNWRSHWRC